MSRITEAIGLSVALTLVAGMRAETLNHSEFCGRVHGLENEMSRSIPSYAPDRLVDINHLILDIIPDFSRRTLVGTATFTFTPIAAPLIEMKLNAIDLNVKSVTSSHAIEAYQTTKEAVIATFEKPIPPGVEVTLVIDYSAEPQHGLYFRTKEMGYPEGDTQLWTQGEPEMHRHWFPSHDYPNEKFTTEMICHVPSGMTVLSNGRLVDETKESPTGLVAFRWLQEKPHVNYLISLVAGYLESIKDQHKDIPLAFYTPPSLIDYAKNSFQDTRSILAFFEEEIGYPYPWAKYYNVSVLDFMWGGMENTSVTTLTTRTLFSDASENIHSTRSLDAHEAAHQWFGDLVTCKDWSHIWLNEGFATYYASLYEKHAFGKDAFLYEMWKRGQSVLRRGAVRPIVSRDYGDPEEQFRDHGYLAYSKGCWVLHMLRSQLGAPLYNRCILTYLNRHEFDTVETEDLKSVIEEFSGRSMDRFFDQWLYHAGHPVLKVTYVWDQNLKLARVSVAQKQEASKSALPFHFPLPVRFYLKDGVVVDRQMAVDDVREDFWFKLESSPERVRIDPDQTLLAEIDFGLPNAMISAQLAARDDMMGRLLAVKQLSGRKTVESVRQLKRLVTMDPFFGIRIQAAEGLTSIQSPEAFEALRGSTDQEDARVRRSVVQGLARFYSDEAFDTLQQLLPTESNPDIQSVILRALGKYPESRVRPTLLRRLKSESFQNRIAEAAIRAMRDQDDPGYTIPLRQHLELNEAQFTSNGYAEAMGTLAFLARNEENKDSIREFLLGRVNHLRSSVQLGAIRALGTLNDTKSIPVLETFAFADDDSPLHQVTESALKVLRENRAPSAELGSLRKEVLDVQKDLRRVHEEITILKDRLKASIVTIGVTDGDAAGESEAPGTASPPDRSESRVSP